MIILTGGAGFIGSAFLSKLNEHGETDIIIVDHLGNSQKWQNLVGKDFLDYVEKDDFIASFDRLTYMKEVKAIFHIGACSSTTECDASYLIKNNYDYSVKLAQWAINHKIEFYYASSAATYGDGTRGYSDYDSETIGLRPLNIYGYSKHLFDLWLLKNNLVDQVVGFKYFNVFGPNEYHKKNMRSLVVKAYEDIKRDGVVRLFKSYKPEYKDGEQKRDFVYIKDVVDLMYRFYQSKQIKGIYNIGTGKARSWNDLATSIYKGLNLKPRIEYIEMPEEIKDKYQYFTQADLSKLHETNIELKFRTLEDSVADYVQNYLEKDFARI